MLRLDLPEKIETRRLILSRLRYEDAEEIFYTYASKPEATRFVSWPTHRTIDDTRSFLQYAFLAWDEGRDYSFSVRLKDNNRFIGSIGAINDDGKVQFGYIFSPTQWNRGYATEACTSLLSVLKRQKGIYRIGTFVDAENIASIKVLEKTGLVAEAKLVKWFRFINQHNNPKDCILFRVP